jgi:hypothetical protein
LGTAAAIAVLVAFGGAGLVVRADAGGSISGVVYYDSDMDGLRGPGEAAAPGKKVVLLVGDEETLLTTTESGFDGRYEFGGLQAGSTYIARVVLDADTPCAVDPQAYIQGDETREDADLGIVPRGDRGVSGTLTSDLNENGKRDAGEPALAGWGLRLTNLGGLECQVDLATGSGGEFRFEGLPAGVYAVNVISGSAAFPPRVAWELTFATRPFDLPGAYPDMRFPDASVDLQSSKSVEGMELGVHVLTGGGSITAWIFRDLDRDGERDDGEEVFDCCGILFLRSSAAGLLFIQTVEERVGVGHYELVGLPPGDYTVPMATWIDDPTGAVDQEGRPVRTLSLAEGEAAVVNFGFGPQPPESEDEPLPLTPTPEATGMPQPPAVIGAPETGGGSTASTGAGIPIPVFSVAVLGGILGPALLVWRRRHRARNVERGRFLE